jgi:two-component system, LuxR family, sensor kinase FixL
MSADETDVPNLGASPPLAASDADWLKQHFPPGMTGSCAWDIATNAPSWSDEFLALYGLTKNEIAPDPNAWLDVVHPDDRASLADEVKRTAQGGDDFERTFRIRQIGAGSRWMHAHCRLERDGQGTLQRLIIDNTDVTSLKQAEHALQACARRLCEQRIATPAGPFVVDLEGGRLHLSPSLTALLGEEHRLISLAQLRTRVHAGDAEAALALFAGFRKDNGNLAVEGRMRRANGVQRWLAVSCQTVLASSHAGISDEAVFVGMATDITEQKRVDLTLAAHDASYMAILETCPDAIILIDRRGVMQSFNAVAVRLFGYRPDEAIGRSVSMLMTAEHAGVHNGYIARYLSTRQARVIGSSREVEARHKDGTVFPAEIFIGEIHDGGDYAFVGFLRDLRDRHQAEANLRGAQLDLFYAGRISAAGEIAAAIAHELNQPLAAATNYLNAARRFTGLGDRAAEARAALEAAAGEQMRTGQILQRLRKFLSKEDSDRRREPLSELLREAISLATAGSDSEKRMVTISVASDVVEVVVDRIQIQQVIFNLVRNGLEAMRMLPPEHAGQVTIRAERAGAEAVQVSIEDNGPGIDPAILPRLFDAFTSTKSGGMGVGLRICKTIIEHHRGQLFAQNMASGGARFVFTLPTI